MIISLDTEKAFDKTQYPFIIKVFNIFGIQGIYLNIIKALYSKQIVYFKLNWEKLKAIPLKSGTRQSYQLSRYLFNTVLEVLPRELRQIKENKGIQSRKKRSQSILICKWYDTIHKWSQIVYLRTLTAYKQLLQREWIQT